MPLAIPQSAAGQLTSATNALAQTTSYHYNASSDLISITNANNVTQASYTYDAYERVATFTDSEGWMVSYAYDAADRVTKVSYPDGTAQSYSYNKLDLASYQDRLGRLWTYVHDANRRLTSSTDPSGHQLLYAYNPTGQITSLTDPNNHVTQWAYDVEGRLTTKAYADLSTLVFTYENTTSRLKSMTDALGQSRQLAYAKDDRITAISYLNAVYPTPNVAFAYDPYFPRRVSMTDGTGATTYAYVPVGSLGALRVQQETTPLVAGTISYGYDALGRLASRTVAGQGAETFAYDAIGRLTGHTSDLGSFTLGYLGQTGQITSRQLASSNLATTWSYLTNANDRRLASVGTAGLSAGQSSTFSYVTNPENQTTGQTQASEVAIAYPPGSLLQTASYNNLNQLTNLSGQAQTFDADGNLTSNGTRTYSWDAENRLIAIAYPGQSGKATTFAYDGLGRRVSWSSTPAGGGAVVTNYLWCGQALCQARNATNAPTRGYYGEGEFVPGSPSASYYYAPDRVGSVRRVFSASAAPTYDYDAYGNPLQATAALTDYGYAGMITNRDSGLNLTILRPFDPVTGRFLLRDPIGEAGDSLGNVYAYVGGDPVDKSDPAGLAGPWNMPAALPNRPGPKSQPPCVPSRPGGPPPRGTGPVLALGASVGAAMGPGVVVGSGIAIVANADGTAAYAQAYVTAGGAQGEGASAGANATVSTSANAFQGLSYGGTAGVGPEVSAGGSVTLDAQGGLQGVTGTAGVGVGEGAYLTETYTQLVGPQIPLPPVPISSFIP